MPFGLRLLIRVLYIRSRFSAVRAHGPQWWRVRAEHVRARALAGAYPLFRRAVATALIDR